MSKIKKILATALTLAMCFSISVPVFAAETNETNVSQVSLSEDDYGISPAAVAPGDNIGTGQKIGNTRIQVDVNVTTFSSEGVLLRAGVVKGTGTYDCYVTTPNGNTYLIGSNISCDGGKTPYYKTPYQDRGTYRFTFYISNSDTVGCLAWVYKPVFY